MVLLKQSYLKSAIEEVGKSDVLSFISSNKQAVEWIKEDGKNKRIYFDLDATGLSFELCTCNSLRDFFTKKIRDVLRLPENVEVLWTMISNGSSSAFLLKPSFHVIVNASFTSDHLFQNKILARRLNAELPNEFKFVKVDDNCYHNGQNFRLHGCCKPDEDRVKGLLLENISENDILKTLITDVDNSVYICTTNVVEMVNCQQNECLNLFEQSFEKDECKGFWYQMAEDYSSWVQFLFVVISCCQENEDIKEYALNIFSKFSEFSIIKYTVHNVINKFESEWSNRLRVYQNKKTANLRKKIIRQLKKTNPELSVTARTEMFDSNNYDLEDIEDGEIFMCPFFPTTSMQFVVLYLLNHLEYKLFWSVHLKTVNDLIKLNSLLKAIDEDERNDIEYYKVCYEEMKQLSGYESNPFGHEPELQNETILRFICDHKKWDYNVIDKKIKDNQNEQLEQLSKIKSVFFDELNKYCEKVEGLTERNTLFIEDYKRRLATRIRPSPEREVDTSVLKRIKRIYETGVFWKAWKYEIPYVDEVNKLLGSCFSDETLLCFMLFKCSAKLFVAETYYRLLCSAHNDQHAAEIIFQLYPYWIRTPQGIMVFDSNTGNWTKELSSMNSVVISLRNFLQHPDKKAKRNYGCVVDLTDKVVKRIQNLVSPNYDEFERLKDSSTYKLLFGNGVYDGLNDKFISAIAPNEYFENRIPCFINKDIFFTAKINDPYATEIDESEIEDMKNVLFYNMHGKEIGDYHCECLALAILGERHKGFYVHVGETNSGKSTEKALIEASFGTFIGTGLLDELSVIKDDKRDGAISNSMVWDNWDKRLLLFSEKNQRKIDTEKLKSYSSGGQDKIRARTQYQKSVLFDIKFLMLFYLNHPLEVNNPTDPAFIDRAKCFHWEKSFVDEHKITDPTCQVPKRDDVCLWQYDLHKRQVFVKTLLSVYQKYKVRGCRLETPEKVKYSTSTVVGVLSTNDDLLESFFNFFIVDGDQNNYLEKNEIEKICNENNIDELKFIRRLSIVCTENNISKTPIESSQKRVKGKRCQIWKGLRKRTEELTNFPILNDVKQWKKLMRDYNGQIPSDVSYKLHVIQQRKDNKLILQEDRDKADIYEMELGLTGLKRVRDELEEVVSML